jgi:zinc protease
MPLRGRWGREEIAAGTLACVLVLSGAAAWARYVASRDACCDAADPHAASAPIPTDPYVATRRLPNGLRYYVRANRAPKQRAELRLVVNAGSVLEDEDQRGLAHGLEHMLFRGTRRFPGHTIQDYLESVGMRAGEDLNGHTTSDETTYEFTVPTDPPGVLDTAITMLADMAHDATFDSTEARAEAGVVLAEWRSNRDASERISESRDSMLLGDSRYARRRPIGDTAVIRRFDLAAMRRFYRDWYRPDLMAIVVVGDFDPVAVERLIVKEFGAIPAIANPRPRPHTDIVRLHGLHAAPLSDPEATGTRLSLWLQHPAVRRGTRAEFRRRMISALWRDILDARLDDASDQPDSPLLGAGVHWEPIARGVDAEVVGATVVESRLPAAVDLMIDEVQRLARDGPTPREVREETSALLRAKREAAQWADASGELASAYVDEFLTGNRALTRQAAFDLSTDVLATVGVDDVIAAARAVSPDSGAYLFATGSASHTAGIPTAAVLARHLREATSHPAARVEEVADSADLISELPTPGRVAVERALPQVQAFDWTLSNGMRLILKPTRFSFDEMDFRLVGPGGASLASDADYPSAWLSDEVIRHTGIGRLNGRKLAHRIDASSISLNQTMSDASIEFTGSVAPDDLELLFQLLHLYFTAPRSDTVAFRRFVDRWMESAKQREQDPEDAFDDTLDVTLGSRSRRTLRNSRAFLEHVDLQQSLAFWKARTANAGNFTLVISGDFTLDRVRTLAERYLASLPGGVHEQPHDDGTRFPTGVVRKTIRAGAGPKAKTSIVLSGPYDHASRSSEALSAARDLASLALENRLRETLGATYGVSVSATAELVPPTTYQLAIEFEADPGRIDALADAVLLELARLRTDGPTEAEVRKVRAAETRDLDNKMESNSYWASELSWHSRVGLPLESIATHQDSARVLTRAALRDACASYLGTSAYVRVTMLPKRWHAPAIASAPSVPQSRLRHDGN